MSRLGAEIHEVEQVADHPPPAVGRDPVAAGEEVQVLPDLHVVVDPEAVRHEPEDAPHVVGVPTDRRAGDLGVTGVGHEQGREDPQRRRLAGAVGPDEAEDLALLDVEIEAADGERAGRSASRGPVALTMLIGRDPVMATGNWKYDGIGPLVDEPDLDLAARRVHPAGRRRSS